MKNLINSSIHKRWLMLALFVLLAFFGYYSWKQLSVEAYPDIADVTSQVVTQVQGLAAEEVEKQITIPLERAINGLPGMHVMRSRSIFGLSLITVVFDDGVEDYWARMRIQERISNVNLPYGAQPGLDPLTSPIGEIYRYIIESKNRDLRELTDLQNWVIIPRLKQVSGVVDVANFGGITTQYQIEIDPHKLEQYEIGLSDVTQAIENNNANAGGSVLPQGDQGYVIRGIGLVNNLQTLGNIVVKSIKGVPVFVKDLGALKLGTLERKGTLGYTDRTVNYSDGIQGIVIMLKHQNPSVVLDGVHKAVEDLNANLLPKGVTVRSYIDRTSLVSTTLETVSHTLLEGMSLVIIVLIIFLGNWRGAMLVAITVPVALLIAFILMKLTNIPANLLSLGAVDFGIIVDGAIVMMETILKIREDHPLEELSEKSIGQKALDVAKPIFFSTIIIITAYLPLFAFERVEKKLFTPMAFTVGYALFGALAVALLLIPGLAYAIYRKPRKMYHNKWLEKLTDKYHARIQKIVDKPKSVFAPLLVVLVGTIILTMTVGKDFLPELDEGSIWMPVQLPPGITLEKSKEMSDTLRSVIMKYPEVTYVMVQAGRNDEGTDYFTPSHFEVSVGLRPYREWKNGRKKIDLINDLAKDFRKRPGYLVGFTQPMIDGVMDKIAGAHTGIVLKVFGKDLTEARRIGEEVLRVLQKIKGTQDIFIDQEPPLPQLQIIVDRDATAKYALNISDVQQLIEVALGGRAVSNLFIGDRVYEISCRYRESERNSPEKIGNLMLTSATGAKIPLSQVAKIKMATGESSISHEDNKRQLTVGFNIRGRDLTSYLNEAMPKVDQQVKYDHELYGIKWGGQFENQNRAYARLSFIVPLALAIMFILLYGAFGKFRQAGLLMSIVPLALFGGMAALNIRGMTLNVSSAVGFIALFGVAIQNGVIMISHINDLRKKGLQLKEAVLEGTRHRFRPVLMTATVAVLGLLPASLATNLGSDVQRPLATVIVYGLLVATTLTLFILPALYYMMENKWGKNDDESTPPVND